MARIRITPEQVRQVWGGMTSRRFYGDFRRRRGKGGLWAGVGLLTVVGLLTIAIGCGVPQQVQQQQATATAQAAAQATATAQAQAMATAQAQATATAQAAAQATATAQAQATATAQAQATATAQAAPILPVLAGTPLPMPVAAISPQNADRVVQLARWGKGCIIEVAYSPDGKLLAVASSLGVYLYDAATLGEVRFLEADAPVGSVAFSPDGGMVASGSEDKTVRAEGRAPHRGIGLQEAHFYQRGGIVQVHP